MFSLKKFLARRRARREVDKWFGRPEDYYEEIKAKTQYMLMRSTLVEKNERGKVYKLGLLRCDGKEAYLSFTVKNEVQGGYTNPVAHHCIVLKGRIMWESKICLTCPPEKGIEDHILNRGGEIITAAGTPHMFISMGEPSVILEYLDQPAYEQTPYQEFRDQVEASL